MCGIAGSYHGRLLNSDHLRMCQDLLSRRGPDGFGSYNSTDGCQLIHSRLAIIDINDRAAQPFHYDNLVIVFNGEIYNYVELRKTLEKSGVIFFTQSDTEVLAAAWKKWGKSSLDLFDGMWAIAVYDVVTRELVVATDPFGEKPLYYSNESSFVFSSRFDVLPILTGKRLSPDLTQLANYVSNGYKSLFKTDRTFIDGVKRLPPGCFASVTVNGMSITRYWKPDTTLPKYADDHEAISNIRKELINSVKIRLRADVPLAFCLSGGVDSSVLIGAAVKELGVQATGFTIANADERYDELSQIEITKKFLGIDSVIVWPHERDFISSLQEMVSDRMAPVAAVSYYTQNMLYQEMGERGFKVGISGTGADELFTGYYDHHLLFQAEKFSSDAERISALDNWEEHINPIIRNPLLKSPDRYIVNPKFRDHIYYRADYYGSFLVDDLKEDFIEEEYSRSLLRSRMMNELFHEAVPVIVTEDDYNAMYYSIENRSPYLSRPLLDSALRIPEEKLIQNGFGKYYLRKAAEGLAHPDILWNRRKIGFNSSLFEFFDTASPRSREFLLDDSPVYDFVHRDLVESYIGEDLSLNSDSKFLFNLLNAKCFMEMFT